MSPDPQDILESLQTGDSLRVRSSLERLRQDHRLLAAVQRLAQDRDLELESLHHLLLDIHGASLVAHFLATNDLESGMWILACLESPLHDLESRGRERLDNFARRLADCADAGELGRRLGEDYGFAGDQRHYHHPHNSFLNRCLERRLGLPITLVGLWLLLSRRLGLEAWALTLPGHVFAAWPGGYLDCFSGGRAVSREDLDLVARRSGAENADAYLRPASDEQLLQRMALNLAVGYRQRGDPQRALLATSMAGKRLAPPE